MKYKLGQQVRLKDMDEMATIVEVIVGDNIINKKYKVQFADGGIHTFLEKDLTKHPVRK